jgi:electron transfer flavoprotein beta subunit
VHILVLLAGIIDPKWPLQFPIEDVRDSAARGVARPRVLSPFDEASLEVALKLRDADPHTRITAILLDAIENDQLLRTVAAFRLDEVSGVDAGSLELWDARALSSQLCSIVRQPFGPVDLLLMGRELGDRDDGTLPACIAEQLAWRFVGMVQCIERRDAGVQLVRERGSIEERITLAGPLVASVTNDRRNRLRHPLMKNVVAAKRASFTGIAASPATEPESLVLMSLEPSVPGVRQVACRFFSGTPAEQAAGLASFLGHWRSHPRIPER